MLRLRPGILPADYAPMAAILNASRALPTTPEDLAATHGWWPEGSISYRMIAEDGAGQVIGFMEAYRFPNTAEGKFYVNVVVLPASRNRGTGSALLSEAERFVAAQGGNRLEGDVQDTDAASLAFMEKRGYKVERHGYDSTLELRGRDENCFAHALDAVEAAGIRFFTLADRDTPALRRALYELYGRTMVDIPGYEARSFMAYETWSQFLVGGKGFRPDWVIIAADGDRLVGVTQAIDCQDHIYTNHTLVDQAFRGRGIARALKVLAIRAAIRHGAPSMRTGNDSLNGPMLALNRKLGYKPLAGDYTVVRRL